MTGASSAIKRDVLYIAEYTTVDAFPLFTSVFHGAAKAIEVLCRSVPVSDSFPQRNYTQFSQSQPRGSKILRMAARLLRGMNGRSIIFRIRGIRKLNKRCVFTTVWDVFPILDYCTSLTFSETHSLYTIRN